MKRGPQDKEKKMLSANGLLGSVRTVFRQIDFSKKDPRGKPRRLSKVDSLMSALAMFSLKSPSLLAFDQAVKEPVLGHNLRSLYGVNIPPSDSYMRKELDEVDPRSIRGAFLSIFHEVQRGKLLERFKFLGTFLIAVDGSEVFNSEDVHCDNCCQRHHKDGRITYYHQILAAAIVNPNMRQVIPFCPEPITKPDGATKNDCESNAAKRFLADLKREHPRLQATIVSDALSANAPHINRLEELGYYYIINVKPDGNPSLFEWLEGVELEEITTIVGKNTYKFRYYNEVPLNDTKNAPQVNFLECVATEVIGKRVVTKKFTWVTNHKITKDNVVDLMKGGRARWKIENETFNTLKNQGYQFEHNFGHGQKYLHTVFALLMVLAFLIDQVQEASCGLFQKALEKCGSRRALWERMRNFFYICRIPSWEELFRVIGSRFEGLAMGLDTS